MVAVAVGVGVGVAVGVVVVVAVWVAVVIQFRQVHGRQMRRRSTMQPRGRGRSGPPRGNSANRRMRKWELTT